MGILNTIKRWIMKFTSKAQEEFDVRSIVSNEMDTFVEKCARIYAGKPDWLDDEAHIKTINFAKAICEETAKLTTLGISIKIEGSARATWLQEQIDKVYYELRKWVEYGCAYGTVALKPNGEGIDCLLPTDFIVTDSLNGKVTGAVFFSKQKDGKKYYTRLEYHRFIDDIYYISNRCYVADNEGVMGDPIDIKKTPWKHLTDEIGVTDLKQPLYAILTMPTANNIDVDSPLGMPRISEAIEELKDLDIAYSRNSKEIYESERTVLLDSDMLMVEKNEKAIYGETQETNKWASKRQKMKLPDYVRNVTGDGASRFYQEINPTLATDIRLTGINALLSQIGFKCGFSNGYFVFNEKTGMITATQVESDDRRTIQTIKDIRDALEKAVNDLLYALDKMADLYDLSPVGAYEVAIDMGDITYNLEEDRLRWWQYVTAGKVPAWKYFVKFEGMTEEEAKAMGDEVMQAQKEQGLFDE